MQGAENMVVQPVVASVFKELGFEDELLDSTRLREDLEMDSTALVQLAMALEKRLAITIDIGNFQALGTFGELIEFLDSATPSAVRI